MEPETARRIEETVKEILKDADMDLMTEFKVRVAAGSRLGLDLSSLEHKEFIRKVVESFLLSTAEREESVAWGNDREDNGGKGEVETKELEAKMVKEVEDERDRFICKLSDKRNVVVHDFRGKTFVSIRENFQRNGRPPPSARGMHFTVEQWSNIKQNIPAIEDAIRKLQSRVNSDGVTEGKGGLCGAETKFDVFGPLETTRFDGKNYKRWASQMELFLERLNLSYVLIDPCSSSSLGPQPNAKVFAEAKSGVQRWMSDDYLCRHHILSSLCDDLYHLYSKKSSSAKELWDELALIYSHEEFGTRSLVRKYIQYQMVEDKPVLEQVQEFNKIRDKLVADGVFIDQDFHVSATIPKLPPSWKDFCIKVMNEEYLTISSFLDLVGIEQGSRSQGAKVSMSECLNIPAASLAGPSIRGMEKTNFRRHVMFCKACGKKGHIARFCWGKKSGQESLEKPNGVPGPEITQSYTKE